MAVVANHSSLINKVHLVDTLISSGVSVVKIFCPEHGFRGDADAGEVVKDGKDVQTGLPIVSLYGSNKKPQKEQMEGVEVVVFDIQDVGVRFYTYISTMHYVMVTNAYTIRIRNGCWCGYQCYTFNFCCWCCHCWSYKHSY